MTSLNVELGDVPKWSVHELLHTVPSKDKMMSCTYRAPIIDGGVGRRAGQWPEDEEPWTKSEAMGINKRY